VKIGEKNDLTTKSFAVFETRFVTKERLSPRHSAFALSIRVSILLFSLPSLMNTTLRYANFPHLLQCITAYFYWPGYVEKHTTSVHLVLIFIPAWSHAGENPIKYMSKALFRGC